MPRSPRTPGGRDVLHSKISDLTALIKELSPGARVEVSFERYEDEDAHIRIYPPLPVSPEDVSEIELKLGECCNDVLLDTGLFIIGAVCD